MLSRFIQKRGRHPEKMLIPKSLFSIVLDSTRDYFSYCQDVVTLPQIFYSIVSIHRLMLATIPMILIRDSSVWGDNQTLSRTLNFLSFFLRFGSIYIDYGQVLASSIVNISFLVIIFLPICIFTPIYKVTGRVPRWFCIITTLCSDFLLHFAFFWMASQIGTIIALLIMPHESENNTGFVALLVVYFVFLVFFILYMDSIIFPQVNFTKGRTLTWISQTMTIIHLYITVQLILTRICEEINTKNVKIALIVIFNVIYITSIVFMCILKPIIENNCMSVYNGCNCSGTVVSIFIILKFYIDGIYGDLLIIAYIIFAFTATMLFQKFFSLMEIYYLKNLDDIHHEQKEFDDVFKNPTQFLSHSRAGFKNAHPYILTFEPFSLALFKWPKSQRIWIQYLRFLSVYFEETAKMIGLLKSLKKQKFAGLHMRSFKELLIHTANSRNRHMSLELKTQFKDLEEQIRATKNLLVIYWSAIGECSASSAYDIGKQLDDKIQNIESMFARLILLYPNNAFICSKFSNFLLYVECDKKEADMWKRRANILKDHRNFMIDITQQFALGMFPLLPKTLADLQPVIGQGQLDGSLSFDIGSSTTHSSSRLSFDASENSAYESSHIRQLGLHAPVPFTRNFILIGVFYILIAFLFGSFTPSFIVLSEINKMTNYFNGISNSCSIAQLLEIIPTYLMYETLRIENILPNSNDELSMLRLTNNETNTPYSEIILERLKDIDKNMHQFIRFTSLVLDSSSNSSVELLSPTIPFFTYSTMDSESFNSTVLLTVKDSTTALIGNFFQYSTLYASNQQSYKNQDWFIQSIKNSEKVSNSMINLINLICDDVRNILHSLKQITLIIMIIFCVICASFCPVGIFLILNIRKQWLSVVEVISSMPHVAIQKTISHFSRMQNNIKLFKNLTSALNVIDGDGSTMTQTPAKLKKDIKIDQINKKSEGKYTSIFIQMVSSRDVKNGLPQGSLLALVAFDIALSIAVFLILYFIIESQSQELVVIPYRSLYSCNLIVNFNRISTLVMRFIACSENQQFLDDTRESLIEQFDELIPIFKMALNDFLSAEVSGYGVGVLSSTNEVIDSLFESNSLWLEERNLHNKLLEMPNLVAIDALYEIIVNIYKKASNFNYEIEIEDRDYINLIHFVLNHLSENSFSEINKNYQNLRNSMINTLIETLFFISSFIFVIGIVILVILTIQLVRITRTTRFCLSALSMVDVHFLTESSNIMQLFTGNFHNTDSGKNSLQAALIKLQEVIDDSIIVINQDLNIIAYNKKASDSYKFSEKTVIGAHINSALSFENPEVITSASQLFNSTSGSTINNPSDENENSNHQANFNYDFPYDNIPINDNSVDEIIFDNNDVQSIDQPISISNNCSYNTLEISKSNINDNSASNINLNDISISKNSTQMPVNKISSNVAIYENLNEVNEWTFETRVSAIDDKYPDYTQSVSLHLVTDNSKTNIVIVIAKRDEIKQKNCEIEEINKKIEELKISAIPSQLLGKYNIKENLEFPVKNGIIVYIDMVNFSSCIQEDMNNLLKENEENKKDEVTENKDISENSQPKDTADESTHNSSTHKSQQASSNEQTFNQTSKENRITQFFDLIDETIAAKKNVCVLRSYGTGVYLCFNIIYQKSNIHDAIISITNYCETIIERCKEMDIVVKCAISYDKTAVAGILSNKRLSFDYFGNSRKIVYKLAWHAEPYSVIYDNSLNTFLDTKHNSLFKGITIQENEDQKSTYSIIQF